MRVGAGPSPSTSANRYPEFLPERLRALIAGHVGVREEQVVIGAGATGVVMQVLQRGDQSRATGW